MVANPQPSPEAHQHLSLEYEQLNENFRFLADVRFKLLALIPPLGGVAVFVLSHLGLTAEHSGEGQTGALLLVVIISVLGLLVTLGITLYDQRNSEFYNALIHRARHLELSFRVPSAPGGLTWLEHGGQFRERPAKNRRIVGLKAAHDTGLALIYGPVLGAWFFPLSYSLARLFDINPNLTMIIAVSATCLAAFICTLNLLLMDWRDKRLYDDAGRKDTAYASADERRDRLAKAFQRGGTAEVERVRAELGGRAPEQPGA